MKLLADENIESLMIHWLRDTDHDVLWAAEKFVKAYDRDLIKFAHQSSRILLTRDLDFGELVIREQRSVLGIILLRIQAANQYERLSLFKKWWDQIEANALNNFLVVTNKHLRIRPLIV